MSNDLFQRIESLPKSLQQQVADFIDFLISKNKLSRKASSKKILKNFEWEGALKSKLKGTSSVDLQHQIWK